MNYSPGISKGIDPVITWLFVIICLVGVISIFSVEFQPGENIIRDLAELKKNYTRQLMWLIICAVVAIIILLTDSKFFTATANLQYAFGIFLLLLTVVIGKDVKGSRSWIPLGGGFNLQPAELCKIFTVLALAKYLSLPETDFTRVRSQLIAVAIALVPAAIIVLQKETGLALVYLSLFLVMYREGLPVWIIATGFSFIVLVIATLLVDPDQLALMLTGVAVLAIYFYRKQIKRKRRVFFAIMLLWGLCVGVQRFAVPYIFKNVLQKHQVERIFDLFGIENPYAASNTVQRDAAPRKKDDENYNVKQSKIAIGSGRITGKGFLKGTQTRGDFVPEQHTDFIFTAVAESFGFLGAIVLLGLYFLMLMRMVTIAERQRSVFSRVYTYGVASIVFFHLFINIGMTIGLMPVIGIPLPLMSYGGSSLLTFTILIFIMIRLDADRQMILR